MFWDGPLTKFQVASMLSFAANGFEVNLWSFQDYNLPSGIVKRDASELMPRDILFKYNHEHWNQAFDDASSRGARSLASDYFRLAVAAKLDGWYSDCDVFCLKHANKFEELKQISGNVSLSSAGIRDYVVTSVMNIKNKSLANDLLKIADTKLSQSTTFEFGELGFLLMSDAIKNFGLEDELLPDYVFSSGNGDPNIFWSSSPEDLSILASITKNSFAIHWGAGFGLASLEDGGSFMSRLFSNLPQDILSEYPSI